MPVCPHIEAITSVKQPEIRECAECVKIGDSWVHLRTCQQCGATLCCDSSPNRHASKHAAGTDHPLIRSLEPGEQWVWCFTDEVAMIVNGISGETRIPPSPMLVG